jgi:hypothetical protein
MSKTVAVAILAALVIAHAMQYIMSRMVIKDICGTIERVADKAIDAETSRYNGT